MNDKTNFSSLSGSVAHTHDHVLWLCVHIESISDPPPGRFTQRWFLRKYTNINQFRVEEKCFEVSRNLFVLFRAPDKGMNAVKFRGRARMKRSLLESWICLIYTPSSSLKHKYGHFFTWLGSWCDLTFSSRPKYPMMKLFCSFFYVFFWLLGFPYTILVKHQKRYSCKVSTKV